MNGQTTGAKQDDRESFTWFAVTAHVHKPKEENPFPLIYSFIGYTKSYVFIANTNYDKIIKLTLTQI